MSTLLLINTLWIINVFEGVRGLVLEVEITNHCQFKYFSSFQYEDSVHFVLCSASNLCSNALNKYICK